MADRIVKARVCCPACGRAGPWFEVVDRWALTEIAARLRRHEQGCTAASRRASTGADKEAA